MNFIEIKKLLKSKLNEYLKDFGFVISEFDKQGILLTHQTADIVLEIGFGCYDRANGYEFSGGGMSVQFVKVEEKVQPLILNHKLYETATPPSIDQYTSTVGSYDMPGDVILLREQMSAIHIDSIEDVPLYLEVFNMYIDTVCLPWFEKYSKLDGVNGLINELGMQDILNCFSAPFPTQFYRAMVITEMCNNRARTLEIRDECLRRFADCKKDSFYTPLMIASYEGSLQELCAMYNII
jgi:hypothetical protein